MISLVYLNQESKRNWLQEVCNKFGDFKVTRSFTGIDGEHYFCKHKSVLECWHDDLDFLDVVNHRQILPYEIIIDLDDDDSIKQVDRICDCLDEKHECYYCFFTGSRGYHIHIINTEMVFWTQQRRKELREYVYNLFGLKIDYHKASDKVLIAMEYTPHWKTGNMKIIKRVSKWVN